MKIQPFALHEQALRVRDQRNRVLSSNIANADTPNFKARDVDFRRSLQDASPGTVTLATTNPGHRTSPSAFGSTGDLKYRIPTQPTLDGNTVETDVEQAAFAENAVQYRATLAFLDGQIRTLRYAIKGGD